MVVARRLNEPVRDYDTVARLGGDEFAVLLQDLEPRDTPALAQRIIDIVEQPIEIKGRQVRIGCSIGIAQIASEASPEDVLRHADLAMYEAKRRGKARFVRFDLALDESESETPGRKYRRKPCRKRPRRHRPRRLPQSQEPVAAPACPATRRARCPNAARVTRGA